MHAAAITRQPAYEFSASPEPGGTLQVAGGVHWLRMPLPFALAHINLWLLEEGDNWAIVDTGVATEESRSVWERTFAGCMRGRDPSRVIVSHLHPDHAGGAGWLTARFDVPLYMTREEYLLCRVLVADTGRMAPEAGDRFYRGAGFPPEALQNYHKVFGYFGRFVAPLPESYHRIRDGDRLAIGGHSWEVVVGRGHSPEHACLFCEETGVLIAGDQILPRISPNISVQSYEPDGDPLARYLASLRKLRGQLPPDILVLPSHNLPFRGVHQRIHELAAHHDERCAEVLAACDRPMSAADMVPVLWSRQLDRHQIGFALGEALAHLHYLESEGRAVRVMDAAGVYRFKKI